ncbi:MAG: hypothetical protein HQM16_05830 [Deltaproteobacteria bacterium]|nr:hypothetical protein [Deltaproteobacteria bacterium]
MNNCAGSIKILFLLFVAAVLSVPVAAAAQSEKSGPGEQETTGTPVLTEMTDSETEPAAEIVTEHQYPITNLGAYNIYQDLPKVGMPLRLLYSPFSKLVYGPFEPAADLYKFPYPSVEEITQRITTLKSTIEKLRQAAKEQIEAIPEKERAQKATEIENKLKNDTVEMSVHLADLYAMKFYKTRNEDYVREASEIYKEAYNDIPASFAEQTSVNMTMVLIAAKEFATAFPVIKKLVKKSSSTYLHNINDTMLEFYFLSGRLQKALDAIDVMIDKKTLAKESEIFLVRTGDVYFLLNQYQDAVEWYLSRLKPKEQATEAENLSWLYMAEALYQTEKIDKAIELYRVMKPFFVGTVYEPVILYRTAATVEEKTRILNNTHNQHIVAWMRATLISEKFLANPALFTEDNFVDVLDGLPMDSALRDQVTLMMAYALRNNNKMYEAMDYFHMLEVKSNNRYLRGALNELIAGMLYKKGLSTKTADEALAFIRYLLSLKYSLRTESPEEIYNLLHHNLALIGIENASAELTMRIIDSSVHTKRDKIYLELKMARDMHEVFAYKQSERVLGQIDVNLLGPAEKVEYYTMHIANLLDDVPPKKTTALDILTRWGNEGTTPKHSYWIALKKTEILYQQKEYESAMETVTGMIGTGDSATLPPEFDAFITPLIAYQVMLYNHLDKHKECLGQFFKNQTKILETKLKRDVLMSALSSAMALKKNAEINTLMDTAKTFMDKESYDWLNKWVQGKIWVDQINRYLDRSNLAVKNNEEEK